MNAYAHVPAARWLVSRETHPSVAKEAWARDQPAMLRTGTHFEAVRLSADLIHHIARSADREAVERAFAKAGIDSAVIVDPPRRWYYAPPGTHWLLTPPDGEEALCDPGDVRSLTTESPKGELDGSPSRHNVPFTQGR